MRLRALITASTVAQDPVAVEGELGLDRPTRRLIQRGLRNEGFDPGTPDGLFGPRTRGAIRRWQEARGLLVTGYLDSPAVERLRVSGTPPAVPSPQDSSARFLSGEPPSGVVPGIAAPTVRSERLAASCEDWNTEAFFETATAASVLACLSAGADVAVRDADSATPLHWAAWTSDDAAVIDALLADGADPDALTRSDRTPLQHAAANNPNPTVMESLLAAGANARTRTSDGRTLLHLSAQYNTAPAVSAALLASGADVGATTDDGALPAHLAARYNGNPAVLEVLVAAGAVAERSATERDRNTPAVSTTGNAGDLPPEILVDRHLVRIERLVSSGDHGAARDVIRDITSLQQEHGLVLTDEFHFTYAKLAFASGMNVIAKESANRYLLAAGRDGDRYREALELLDSAEEALRQAEAERHRAEARRQRAEDERQRAAARQRENYELAQRQIAAATIERPRDRLRSGGMGPEMVRIAAGRFERYRYSHGVSMVEFDQPFAIARYEVTRGDFERFVEDSGYRPTTDSGGRCYASGRERATWRRPRFPGHRQRDSHPVVCVSVTDAVAYADWLSQQTGQRYRLPTPAEWQYAARAGSTEAMLFDRDRWPANGAKRYLRPGEWDGLRRSPGPGGRSRRWPRVHGARRDVSAEPRWLARHDWQRRRVGLSLHTGKRRRLSECARLWDGRWLVYASADFDEVCNLHLGRTLSSSSRLFRLP